MSRPIPPKRKARSRGVVVRLVAALVLVSLVPLALLAWTSVSAADHAVRDQVEERLRSSADGAAAFLSQYRQSLAELVQSYSRRPTLRVAFADGNPAHFDRKAIDGHLNDLLNVRTGIRGTFATDVHGVLTDVLPPTPAIVGNDFSFRDWYRGLVARETPYVSQAYQSAITGTPLVVAAAAYVDGPLGTPNAGKHVGIIAAAFGLEAVESFVQGAARAQGVTLTVLDGERTVLAGPERSTNALVHLDTPEAHAAAEGRSGHGAVHGHGAAQFLAYRPAPVNWAVMVRLPVAAATAPIHRLRQRVLAITGVLAGILFAGGALLVRAQAARVRAEREAAAGGRHLRAVLEAAGDAFVSVDERGRITAWNSAAERIFGWSAVDAVGRSLTETIIPSRLRAAHEAGITRFLDTGDGPILNRLVELTALRSDGTEFPVEVHIWPIVEDGRATFHAFVRDITDRIQHEHELAAARDAALEASRLKSEFLANMSHEIRTPMNGVMGMTSLLLGTPLDEEQREYAQLVLTSAESLLGIINDILDFSKVESGHLEFERIDFDIRAVVEDVAELLAARAFEKQLELGCLIAPAVPAFVKGDPVRLRQVLTNLVGNAVKFTDEGEVVVRVDLEPDAPPYRLRFSITDTGIGLDPVQRDRLFQPFTQADASTTRRFGGTGLGLAISQRLVEMMDGSISVESTTGHGSTFTFTVHLEPATEPTPSVGPMRAGLGGLRVLAVDDNETNRLIVGQMLSTWAVPCETASSGPEALIRIETAAAENGSAFNTILLDMNMPGMDGLEVARRIRSREGGENVRIVLITSSAQRTEIARAGAAGIDGYLTKPVRQSQLRDVLRTVAERRSDPARVVTRERVAEDKRRQRPRILVVEDNIVNQKVAVRMLEVLGYRADVIGDGKAAVDAIESGDYAAVLMDVQMPRMDGFEATAMVRARESEQDDHVPIIAMTASAMQGDRERCLAAGMDDYISKPLRTEALGLILSRYAPTGEQVTTNEPRGAPEPSAPPPAGPEASHADSGDDSQTHSVLSADTLARLRGLDHRSGGALLVQLAKMFRVDTPVRLDAIRAAIEADDPAGLLQAAHSLKGSCSMLGAAAMAALCHEIEALGVSGTTAGAASMLARLEERYDETLAALAAQVSVGGPES